MKILGLDASTKTAGVAIVENGIVLGEIITNDKKTHSQKLMVIVDQILKNLKLKLEELDGIAVSVGPGSFTGIKIGMATAMGLSLSKNIPMVGISSLEALAYNVVEFKNIICPIIDAKRNEVYTAMFKFDGKEMIRLEPDAAINIEQLIEKLKLVSEDVLLVGQDAEKIYEEIRSKLKQNVYLSNSVPRASSVAMLSINREFSSEIKPNYIRKSEAETTYEKKHGKSIYE